MADRYDARIDDFDIDCEIIDDSLSYALVRHEIPYKKGATLENMGSKARCVKLKLYWYNDGHNDTYYEHYAFLEYLDNKELGDLLELSHPKYGIMKGDIETIAIHHDDREETAEVEILFVEDRSDDTEPTEHVDVEGASESEFLDGQDELIDTQVSALGTKLGSVGGSLTNAISVGTSLAKAAIDKTKSLTSQVSKLTSALPGGLSGATAPLSGAVSQASGVAAQARGYIAKADTLVTKLRSLP